MQSIFRLPWCTDNLNCGIGDQSTYGPGPTPTTVDLNALKKFKRKRAVTPDPQDPPHAHAKKQRPATAIASDYFTAVPASRTTDTTPLLQADPISKIVISKQTVCATDKKETKTALAPGKENMATAQDVQMADAPVESKATRLQQAIENQLNLQILMKHNELRLIEQELAKCQIAMEQLRRCELKQFPGDEAFDYAVSCGTGTAALPPSGYTKPSHAAPHGVVDNPYSRHYRRWLLPDAQFDSQPIHAVSPVDDANLAGRSTRHAGVRKTVAVATPQRYGDNLQSLPSYQAPAPKKDCSTPLVLRRSTDNKLVKLVCNNCNRGNMSSIQGFLNHCRIAHKVVYESHDAAAIDCGRILDDAEIASLPTEAQTMPVSKPVVKHTPSRTASTAAPVITTLSVHPMNKPGAPIMSSKPPKPTAKPAAPLSIVQPSQIAATPFKAAAGLPKLSALFARKNCGGDLDQAALDARRKSEFMMDDVMSPASMTPTSPAIVTPTGGRGMLGAIGGRFGGKSLGQSSQRPQQSYFAPSQRNDENVQSPGENLSPHTIDSNPGLVSDVEDDDNGSASEEESHAAHASITPFGVRRDCTDNMELDVAVEDGIDQHGVVIRRNSMLSAEERGVHTVGGPSRKFGGN